MKTCKVCNQDKPFYPTYKTNSKASGFHANVCWDCYVVTARLRYQALDYKDPAARQQNIKAFAAKQEAQRAKFMAKFMAKLPKHLQKTLGVYQLPVGQIA